jgi:hypothetical protein
MIIPKQTTDETDTLMIRVQTRPPRTASLLGYAGLLPTAFCLGLIAFGGREWIALGQQAAILYAALIFSFLGGAWWGLAARDEIHPAFGVALLLSVLPSLAAWACLFWMGPIAQIILGAMLLLSPSVDRWLTENGFTPDWWLSLRRPLSWGMGIGNIAIGAMVLLRV